MVEFRNNVTYFLHSQKKCYVSYVINLIIISHRKSYIHLIDIIGGGRTHRTRKVTIVSTILDPENNFFKNSGLI